jgi:hypothetical protein
VVLVTHEEDIAAYARRVVRMRDGTVLSDAMQEPRGRTPALPPEPRATPVPSVPVVAPAPVSADTLVLPVAAASQSSAEGSAP